MAQYFALLLNRVLISAWLLQNDGSCVIWNKFKIQVHIANFFFNILTYFQNCKIRVSAIILSFELLTT